jgi:ABC-2 type transport system ATP-binding protein
MIMRETVIELSEMTRRFGDTIAVDNLSLGVFAGEVFGFLGHNGAGKTTTVRLLNGLLEPTHGRANVLGYDPQVAGPALRARTGVLTETPSLDERLTARDNLGIAADLFGVPKLDVNRRVNELLSEFALSERADEKTAGFSMGMKKRLALARTLLHKPELLFLDEPTSGLDPVISRRIHELIKSLVRRQGCTVFLCTHNLIEAQKLCERVAVLERGHLVALGTPAELARRYVRRLEVDVEVDTKQFEAAMKLVRSATNLVYGGKGLPNGLLNLTLAGREAIPKLLSLLVYNGIRVYRAAAQDVNLEEVYMTLHKEREGES